MLSSMNGKYGGVSVKYASLIDSCQWIKVIIKVKWHTKIRKQINIFYIKNN